MAVSMLGYLGLGVSDMDKWEQYATEVLGMEIMERASDGTVYLRMDELHHRIALYPDGSDDIVHAGFQTANRKEFEATKASLLKCGVEYRQGTAEEIANRHVSDMVKFDLSGFPTEVYYGPHVLLERPFHSPIAMGGFRTGDQGLGHIGMNVDDLPKAARILEEGLGFVVSDNFGGREYFFHTAGRNQREHTAVLGMKSERDPKRIQHFMVEVNTLDDVGFCLNRVEAKNVPIATRFGRHTNDRMYSFYMRCPSGYRIECGWGGLTVDDTTWQVHRYSAAQVWRTGAGLPMTDPGYSYPGRAPAPAPRA